MGMYGDARRTESDLLAARRNEQSRAVAHNLAKEAYQNRYDSTPESVREGMDDPEAASLGAMPGSGYLNPGYAKPSQDDPIDAIRVRYGGGLPLAAVVGPAGLANQIERTHGTLEAQPSWANAKQFAAATERYTRERLDKEPEAALANLDDEFRKSKFLLAPERYRYMQDTGRPVDLLRDLASGEYEKGADYYRKSEGERLARSDYHDPNYSRFSGFGQNAAELMTTSPLMAGLRVMNLSPEAIANVTRSPMSGLGNTAAANSLAARTFVGQNPVMDIAPRGPLETSDEYAQRYSDRQAQVAGLRDGVTSPLGGEMVRNVTQGYVDPSPFVGDAVTVGVQFLDPTLAAEAGVPAIAKMAGSAVDARVLDILLQEAKGEAVFNAPLIASANAGQDRTFLEYFFGDRSPGYTPQQWQEERDRLSRAQTEAANKIYAADRSNPNDIAAERRAAYGRLADELTENLRDVFGPRVLY